MVEWTNLNLGVIPFLLHAKLNLLLKSDKNVYILCLVALEFRTYWKYNQSMHELQVSMNSCCRSISKLDRI